MAILGGFPPFRSYRVLAAAALAALACLAWAAVAAAQPSGVMEQAERLAERHRYREVVELLEPVELGSLDPARAARVRGSLGRAYFHLGRYDDAYTLLRADGHGRQSSLEQEAYLEAAAYLTGRADEAVALLDAILASGEVDLHAAVTLPGERAFLGDPTIWRSLQNHARPLRIALERESSGLAPGQGRAVAVAAVPAPLREDGALLVLEAGPRRPVELVLSDAGLLEGVRIDTDALLRYTPLRLELGPGLGWTSAPDEVVETLGAPESFRSLLSGGVEMEWRVQTGTLILEFGGHGPARPAGIPEGRVMLLRVELWGGGGPGSD